MAYMVIWEKGQEGNTFFTFSRFPFSPLLRVFRDFRGEVFFFHFGQELFDHGTHRKVHLFHFSPFSPLKRTSDSGTWDTLGSFPHVEKYVQFENVN